MRKFKVVSKSSSLFKQYIVYCKKQNLLSFRQIFKVEAGFPEQDIL